MIRLSAAGRGRHYSPLRGLIESSLDVLYSGDWPARLWSLSPTASIVRRAHHVLPLLPPGHPPLRLAFASDIHVGPTTAQSTLDTAFRLLDEARPDVLLLGGDYVFLDATPARARELERRIASVRAPLKLAVLGNHDLWADHEVIERALTCGGARVIINQHVRLPPPHDDVAVLGLDDPWTGHPVLDDSLLLAADAATRVVLAHSPDVLPLVRDRDVDLLVCGHTHGGQIATPWGPILIPAREGYAYPAGLFREEALHLFVSRGIGGIELPMRAWAPPDIAVIDLVPRRAL